MKIITFFGISSHLQEALVHAQRATNNHLDQYKIHEVVQMTTTHTYVENQWHVVITLLVRELEAIG